MSVMLDFNDGFAVVRLNRPEVLNALSFTVLNELSDAFDRVGKSDARALIVTGTGNKAFCAGADIKELLGRGLIAQREGATVGQATFQKLDKLPIPSMAVINGYAFGGGLELAMACTFRIALPNAKMGLPEIKLGLIPGYGGTQRLPRLVGQARALEMVMSGKTIDAQEAERIGLINRVVAGEDAVEIGREFAMQFTGYSRCASLFAKEAVQRAAEAGLEEGLKVEADLSTLAYQTADAAEGMNAFVEKRKPVFKDE